MRLRIVPGGIGEGEVFVPGDKSIAHRWLILAVSARGRSRLEGLPTSLDVRSTAACLGRISPAAAPSLEAWVGNAAGLSEGHGSTWNVDLSGSTVPALEVEGEGRGALVEPRGNLDCGNSGTAMRLLAGSLAAAPFRSVLVGDESLSARPMERVAEPLREMGALITTTDGHAPIEISGGPLQGIVYRQAGPSAQVKGAILLAGLEAEGRTVVVEPAKTRDHTERTLAALGAPIEVDGLTVSIGPYRPDGFEGRVPGDPSSAAFLVAAAALSGSELTVAGVCLNPTRLGFLNVMRRMGIDTEIRPIRDELGEPVGELRVAAGTMLGGTVIGPGEIPLVVDEVPVLAVLAAHARGETRFMDAGELRVKESDRLAGVVQGIRDLGGIAEAEGDDLVVAGGGLVGGRAHAHGDHRLAMAFAVAALPASSPCEIDGIEAAAVSYPGFVSALGGLGARLELTG
jgi:3-phosphoshikimate 1-carboxyvinyltransferase